MSGSARSGPLVGLRVVEFAGIGPGPHCTMLFADMGAEVLRIDREGGNGWPNPVVDRGRSTMTLDLRSAADVATARATAGLADVVIEGFRPGVMERLGLGPDVLLADNPRLVYGRMTGWGQEGPLAKSAGHDINYLALTGALAAIGKPGEPAPPPLNLVGDFGGGSMFLAFGILSALWERERSGLGQVVDAAIIDGVSSMMTMFAGLLPSKRISLDRADNLLGGAAPFYRSYICGDGRELSVGALEPQFWAEFLERIGVHEPLSQDRDAWSDVEAVLARVLAMRPAAEWAALLEGTDACAVGVLGLEEAQAHPHHMVRKTFESHSGLLQAAPAPRLSRTPGRIAHGEPAASLLERWRE